jgi:hypothetical protein
MHTVIILGAAAALLVACLLLGHAWGGAGGHGLSWGARAFIPLWLVAAGVNLWIGVSRAGYTVAQELPFFAIVFGVPALIAGFIAWKWS